MIRVTVRIMAMMDVSVINELENSDYQKSDTFTAHLLYYPCSA